MAGKHAECRKHRPVQHRDGKPPWCQECGRTASGDVPISRFGLPKPRPRLPDPGWR